MQKGTNGQVREALKAIGWASFIKSTNRAFQRYSFHSISTLCYPIFLTNTIQCLQNTLMNWFYDSYLSTSEYTCYVLEAAMVFWYHQSCQRFLVSREHSVLTVFLISSWLDVVTLFLDLECECAKSVTWSSFLRDKNLKMSMFNGTLTFLFIRAAFPSHKLSLMYNLVGLYFSIVYFAISSSMLLYIYTGQILLGKVAILVHFATGFCLLAHLSQDFCFPDRKGSRMKLYSRILPLYTVLVLSEYFLQLKKTFAVDPV